jgi:agmatine deiminase
MKDGPLADVRLFPEWAPQRALWTAWPASSKEWNGDLESPRRDVAALVRALAPNNRIRVLVSDSEARQSAASAVEDVAELVPLGYGDIWLRDTSPLFATDVNGPCGLRFRNNGWGGKFLLPDDEAVGDGLAALACVPTRRFNFVLEGGAVDHDGAGTILATRQTVLNENRNGWSQTEAEEVLRATLGARKILWIDRGLTRDHTDGHVDNVARFVGPARIVIQEPADADDPNAEVFAAVGANLAEATDALGRKIDILAIPSPGRFLNPHGEVAPASHLNFVIANGVVAVPVFDTKSQADALKRLQAVFPNRKVVGLSASSLLGAGDAGGGAFHCITREEPDFTRGRLFSN